MLQASLVHQRKVKKPPLDMEIRGQRQIHLHPTDPQVGTAPAWVLSSHPMGAPGLQAGYPTTPCPSPGITAHVWNCLMGPCAL